MPASHPTEPHWDPEHLQLAVKAACVALWSWNVDDNSFRMDPRAYELWHIPPTGQVAFEDLSAHIHPADRDRVRAAFIATRSVAGSYEIDFRIIVEDEIRWISARGQGADAGATAADARPGSPADARPPGAPDASPPVPGLEMFISRIFTISYIAAASKTFVRSGLERSSALLSGNSTRVIALGLLRQPPEAIVA